jgi:hypothetical protein
VPYIKHQSKWRTQAKLDELTKDNPSAKNKVAELSNEIKMRFEIWKNALHFDELIMKSTTICSIRWKQIQDEIRNIVNKAQETVHFA